jgi:hypothetical protein
MEQFSTARIDSRDQRFRMTDSALQIGMTRSLTEAPVTFSNDSDIA